MKNLRRILPFALCIIIIILTPFAYKKTSEKEKFPISAPKHKCVLTLWNIDVFEGGVGSRSDFLSKVSLDFKDNGVIVMVVNHTKESALNSIEKGVLPDMISYGVGVDFISRYAKSLPKISFLGGEYGGEYYAYPWCAGAYFVIRKTEDNQPIDRLFVSQNTYNMPYGGIYFGKIEAAQIKYLKPLDAYTSFLSADNTSALLGTQRDLKRLEQRGVDFYPSVVEGFSDLIQYVSIITSNKQRYSYCLDFINFLISEKVQKNLYKIGMTSIFYSVYTEGAMASVDFNKMDYTLSPFISSEVILKTKEDILEGNITNNSLLDFKTLLKRL